MRDAKKDRGIGRRNKDRSSKKDNRKLLGRDINRREKDKNERAIGIKTEAKRGTEKAKLGRREEYKICQRSRSLCK